MTVRPDNRLGDAPMKPVICRACTARVLARKSSWEQTSVQWDSLSLQQCNRRREDADSAGAGVTQAFLKGCPELRESIELAVLQGSLPLVDEV